LLGLHGLSQNFTAQLLWCVASDDERVDERKIDTVAPEGD
jgi:hypothetical protein